MKLRLILAMLIPVLVLVGLGFIPNNSGIAYPDESYPTWSDPAYACQPLYTQVQVEWFHPSADVLPFDNGLLFVDYDDGFGFSADLIYDGYVDGRYRWHSYVYTPDEAFHLSGYVETQLGSSDIYPTYIYPNCWADVIYLPVITK